MPTDDDASSVWDGCLDALCASLEDAEGTSEANEGELALLDTTVCDEDEPVSPLGPKGHMEMSDAVCYVSLLVVAALTGYAPTSMYLSLSPLSMNF